MNKKCTNYDLILFLTFLNNENILLKEVKVETFYVKKIKGERLEYWEFSVTDKKNNDNYRLRIFDDGIENAYYYPPNMNKKNANQIKRFSKWLKKRGEIE